MDPLHGFFQPLLTPEGKGMSSLSSLRVSKWYKFLDQETWKKEVIVHPA